MTVNKATNEPIRQAPLGDIRRVLEAARCVLVGTHVDPDGDALGTQLAFGAYLRQLGKRVVLLRDSDIPEKYGFLDGIDGIVLDAEQTQMPDVDTVLILECPTPDRLGAVRCRIPDNARTVLIDHHRNTELFADINWVDSSYSSVGEMTWEYLEAAGFTLTPEIAEHLYTAVLTDTGRFRYESTTPRTMKCAGELIAAGANPQKICDLVYYNMRPALMKLMGRVLNSVEYHHDDRICVLSLDHSMLAETGTDESDSEGLVDYTLFNRGVVAGALLKEVDDKHTRVSFRSNNHINVSEIAARFGGGGHYNASGCTLPWGMTKSKEEVIRFLIEANGVG